LSGKVMCT